MADLRRLCYLLNANDIHIRPRYIRSAASRWADTLNPQIDIEVWQLNRRIFAHLQDRWGPLSIDRFASILNTQLPRFNAKWYHPLCENVNCLHLPEAARRRQNNYCNPPWTALHTLAAKLRELGAAATVVAPYLPSKPWYQDLPRLASIWNGIVYNNTRINRLLSLGPPCYAKLGLISVG
jgi:hypothetical protein